MIKYFDAITIFTFSDTHGHHNELDVPKCDIAICAGDIANYRNPIQNLQECNNFISWFAKVPAKYKILIAGNHDIAFERNMISKDYLFAEYGIIYLQHQEFVVYVNDIKIRLFGSPYTPEFNQWSFNINRGKIGRYWEAIPEDIDILITHGPPKGVLDLSKDKDHKLEQCGDSALFKKVLKVKPKYHIFGHIHDTKDIINSGTINLRNIDTTFINASCITDARFEYGLSSKGVLINY